MDFKCRVELAMQEQPIQVSNMPVCVDLPQSSITPPPIDNTMSDFGTPIKPNNPAIHIPQTSSRKPSITPSRVEWPIVDVDTPLQLSTPAILIPQTEARRQSFLSMLSSPVSQTPIPKSNTAYHEENDLFSQDSNVIIADHVESSQADYSMSSVVGPSQPTIAPEAPAYARMSVAELKVSINNLENRKQVWC